MVELHLQKCDGSSWKVTGWDTQRGCRVVGFGNMAMRMLCHVVTRQWIAAAGSAWHEAGRTIVLARCWLAIVEG